MLKTKAVLSNSVDTSTVRDYFSLLKPRVMSLVIFTGFIGLYIAPGSIHPIIGFIAILCIAIGSGAAGAINMWYERDIDCLMERTKNRPLPKHLLLVLSCLVGNLKIWIQKRGQSKTFIIKFQEISIRFPIKNRKSTYFNREINSIKKIKIMNHLIN